MADKKLVDFINDSLSKGLLLHDITETLIKVGHSKASIKEAIRDSNAKFVSSEGTSLNGDSSKDDSSKMERSFKNLNTLLIVTGAVLVISLIALLITLFIGGDSESSEPLVLEADDVSRNKPVDVPEKSEDLSDELKFYKALEDELIEEKQSLIEQIEANKNPLLNIDDDSVFCNTTSLDITKNSDMAALDCFIDGLHECNSTVLGVTISGITHKIEASEILDIEIEGLVSPLCKVELKNMYCFLEMNMISDIGLIVPDDKSRIELIDSFLLYPRRKYDGINMVCK